MLLGVGAGPEYLTFPTYPDKRNQSFLRVSNIRENFAQLYLFVGTAKKNMAMCLLAKG